MNGGKVDVTVQINSTSRGQGLNVINCQKQKNLKTVTHEEKTVQNALEDLQT